MRNWITNSLSSIHLKNGNRRYKYLVQGNEEAYFVKMHSAYRSKYFEDDIIKMPEFLVDSISVVFVGKVFQQIVISNGNNWTPLLADIFLYIVYTVNTGRKQWGYRFNFTYRYIDNIFSVWEIAWPDLPSSTWDHRHDREQATLLLLTWITPVDREGGKLHTSIYDKRDDFNFHITNFTFLCSLIRSSPAYSVLSHCLWRYAQCWYILT